MLKLAFDDSQNNLEVVRRHQNQLTRLPQEAKETLGEKPQIRDLVVLFLKWLWSNVATVLRAHYFGLYFHLFGTGIGEEKLREKIKCTFALPARWGPSIMSRMASAVDEAGIPNVEYVSEPEAAAAYIIRENRLQATSQGGILEVIVRHVA